MPGKARIPRPRRRALWGAFALLQLGTAQAQPAPAEQPTGAPAAFGATAVVRAPMAATNGEDATAAGTTVGTRDRGRALEEVGEALIEVPGVRVHSNGGVGSRALVALRGADANHTSVLLGVIPLDTPDAGAFDLGLIPLSALRQVEVYRGGAPVWYGQGSIGGVLRFVPRSGEGRLLQATAGFGSFGRAELRTTAAVSRARGPRASWFGHVRLLRADNDYPYVDDGGTGLAAGTGAATDDDRIRRQPNADIHATDALMHGGVDLLGGRLSLLLAGHGRVEGIAGPLVRPSPGARRKLVRTLVGLSYEHEAFDADGERRHRLQVVASGSHQRNAMTDLYADIGTSSQVASDDRWERGTLRVAAGRRVLGNLEPTLVASLTEDRYRPDNPLAFSMPPRSSRRRTAALAFEPRLFGRVLGMRAELRPSVRGAWSRGEVRSNDGIEQTDEARALFAPTYRLAAALEPRSGLTLAGSVASGRRLPSISELFGDRVYQEPNPDLRPERALAADLGVVARGRAGRFGGAVELRGFMLSIADMIRYRRTAQYQAVPENIARGRILGLEVGARGRYGRHLSLAGSMTAMDTENAGGHPLPLRAPLQLLLRPQFEWMPARVFAELQHISYVPLDDAGATHLPARTLLSAGTSVRLLGEHILLEARVHNLTDLRVSDTLGRPLPGRDYRLALTVRH